MVHGLRQTQDEAEEAIAIAIARLRTAKDLLAAPNNPVKLGHLTSMADHMSTAWHIIDNVIRDLEG